MIDTLTDVEDSTDFTLTSGRPRSAVTPIKEAPDVAQERYAVVNVPIDDILSDDTFNCRGQIIPFDVRDLVESIRERGLDFPVTIINWNRDGYKYKMVAGHRRHLAMKLCKKTEIPANIRTDLDESGQRLLNLNENVCRLDLNVMQEANGIKWFLSQGWSEDLIAAKTQQSRGWVQVRSILLKLPEEIQKEAAAGVLTQIQIRNLFSLKDNDARFAAVRKIKDAKERSETIDISPKKPQKPHDKRERSVTEMESLQEYIQEQIGNNIATRILGWNRGFVSDYEIHCAIKEAFPDLHYRIPKELLDQL